MTSVSKTAKISVYKGEISKENIYIIKLISKNEIKKSKIT